MSNITLDEILRDKLKLPISVKTLSFGRVVLIGPNGLSFIRSDFFVLFPDFRQRFLTQLETGIGPGDRVVLFALLSTAFGHRSTLNHQNRAVLPISRL